MQLGVVERFGERVPEDLLCALVTCIRQGNCDAAIRLREAVVSGRYSVHEARDVFAHERRAHVETRLPIGEFQTTAYRCRCGHEWVPKGLRHAERPRVCPKCKSANWDRPCTLSARYFKDGSEILIRQDGQNPRRLTPRECSRLMGFDSPGEARFRIPVSDTQAYKQFGNAVVVPVARAIAEHMAPWIIRSQKSRIEQAQQLTLV